jgi:enamine deaminase RidA (YjgF/YER057c/UK114 family)
MAERRFINPRTVKSLGAYSHAVRVTGGTAIYVSGQIAIDEEGKIVGPGDLIAQTVQVFENLKDALQAAGATFRDVVKFTTYVVNLKPEQRAVIASIRGQYIDPTRLPASTLVGVSALVMEGLLIEVEAVAVIDCARIPSFQLKFSQSAAHDEPAHLSKPLPVTCSERAGRESWTVPHVWPV